MGALFIGFWMDVKKMNDFTKNELIKLKNSVEYYSDRTSLSDQNIEENNALALKIKSLIDNFSDRFNRKDEE